MLSFWEVKHGGRTGADGVDVFDSASIRMNLLCMLTIQLATNRDIKLTIAKDI